MRRDLIDLPHSTYFFHQIAQKNPSILDLNRLSFDSIQAFQQHPFQIRQPALLQKLKTYLQDCGASTASLENADRLQDPRSLVICTGQQCGFFSGPLLTLYKTITTIQLARQFEQQWSLPVVPLFWNPSEDHDFAEINHLYLPETLEKYTFSRPFSRTPVEAISIDAPLTDWIAGFWKQLPKTEFTEKLQAELNPRHGMSVSAWFSSLLLKLFAEEGLVVVEPFLFRQEGLPIFLQATQKLSSLVDILQKNATLIRQQGFSPLLTFESETSLFFLLKNQERVKGKKEGETIHFQENSFTLKNFEKAIHSNEVSLSANVALRPILQNFLFPAFVYVAGPAEGSYWFELFPLFSQFQVPPSLLYPRLSATLIEPKIQKKLEKFSLSVIEILQKKNPPPPASQDQLQKLFTQMQHIFTQQFQQLATFCASVDATLPIKKTEEHCQQSLETLRRKTEQRLQELHGQSQTQWKQVLNQLYPQETLQERKLNLVPFLNKYGPPWFQELKKILQLDPTHRHQVISW